MGRIEISDVSCRGPSTTTDARRYLVPGTGSSIRSKIVGEDQTISIHFTLIFSCTNHLCRRSLCATHEVSSGKFVSDSSAEIAFTQRDLRSLIVRLFVIMFLFVLSLTIRCGGRFLLNMIQTESNETIFRAHYFPGCVLGFWKSGVERSLSKYPLPKLLSGYFRSLQEPLQQRLLYIFVPWRSLPCQYSRVLSESRLP